MLPDPSFPLFSFTIQLFELLGLLFLNRLHNLLISFTKPYSPLFIILNRPCNIVTRSLWHPSCNCILPASINVHFISLVHPLNVSHSLPAPSFSEFHLALGGFGLWAGGTKHQKLSKQLFVYFPLPSRLLLRNVNDVQMGGKKVWWEERKRLTNNKKVCKGGIDKNEIAFRRLRGTDG